jgi:hypothetical protein
MTISGVEGKQVIGRRELNDEFQAEIERIMYLYIDSSRR